MYIYSLKSREFGTIDINAIIIQALHALLKIEIKLNSYPFGVSAEYVTKIDPAMNASRKVRERLLNASARSTAIKVDPRVMTCF